MQRYEYKVSDVLRRDEVETYMNAMASQGWRVVDTVLWYYFRVGIVVTMEREI